MKTMQGWISEFIILMHSNLSLSGKCLYLAARIGMTQLRALRFMAARSFTLEATNGLRVTIRGCTTDVLVVRELLLRCDYDPLLKSLSLPQDAPLTILDLGANIGLASLLLASKFPFSAIWAVEPEYSNYQMLLENTGGGATIRSIRAFAGASSGLASVDTSLGAWACRAAPVRPGEAPVAVIDMESILKMTGQTSIDLLKCDIEGGEKELFEDCGAWIGGVRNMLIELHAPLTLDWLLGCLKPYSGWIVTGSMGDALFALTREEARKVDSKS